LGGGRGPRGGGGRGAEVPAAADRTAGVPDAHLTGAGRRVLPRCVRHCGRGVRNGSGSNDSAARGGPAGTPRRARPEFHRPVLTNDHAARGPSRRENMSQGNGTAVSVQEMYTRTAEILFAADEIPLGPWTSYSLMHDPKHMSCVLSRYEFCAKILSGKESAREGGAGDAVGLPMTAQAMP